MQWTQRDLADATTALQHDVTERAEEQRAVDEEREKTDEELAKVQADADAAKRARGGLQQLAEIQRQLTTSETGNVSALAAATAAKGEARILLAQLFGEADGLAGKFAKRLMNVMLQEAPANVPTIK